MPLDPERLQLLRRRLRDDTPLIGERRQTDAIDVVESDGSPEAVTALAAAATPAVRPGVEERVVAALARLARRRNPAARESLCWLAMERDPSPARSAALALRCAPREPSARALFYFLTGQWELYGELDPDQGLLRLAYEGAPSALQARVRDQARREGRFEWVAAIGGSRRSRRLTDLEESEWETALGALTAAGRWPDLWLLAQAAPARWSRPALLALPASWAPAEAESAAGCRELRALASACTSAPPDFAHLVGLERALPVPEPRQLSFSVDGGGLIVGCDATGVQVWRLPGRAPPHIVPKSVGATFAFSPATALLATVCDTAVVRAWHLPDLAPVAELRAGRHQPGRLGFSPDGTLLAAGAADPSLSRWRIADGKRIRTVETGEPWRLAFVPDGRLLVSASCDEAGVRLWTLPELGPAGCLEGHAQPVHSLAVRPDSGLLATGGGEGSIRLWSLPDGVPSGLIEGHTRPVDLLAVTRDGSLLVSAAADGLSRLWRLPCGEGLRALTRHRGPVTCLAIAPDGRVLATGGRDGTVRLWTLPDGEVLARLPDHGAPVTCLAASPDGRRLASGGQDGQVRLWDIRALILPHRAPARTTPADLAWARGALA